MKGEIKVYKAQTFLWTMKEDENEEKPILNTPKQVFELCKDMSSLAQESIHILALNTKNKLIDRFLVSLGHINSTNATPREIFRWAILTNAYGIILVHNHPSGNCEPSEQDMIFTKNIIKAGIIVGIQVLDSIIIGNGFLSLQNEFSYLWDS